MLTSTPEEPPHRRHRARWIIVLALLAALIGGGAWWYLQQGPGAYTTVPTIIGQDAAEATAILERAGLGADPTSAFDAEVPKDLVFATEPQQGDRIRKDGTVAFTVSLGPDYVPVPDGVVGAMQADAEAALVAAGLKASYTDPEYSDTVDNGKVLSATLPDGTPAVPAAQAIRGTVLTLTVSSGRAPVTITSVVGITLDAAAAQLKADNLQLAPTEVFSDTVAATLIVDQSPVAGAEGHRGDTIAVNVSKGPEMLALPSTYGQNVKSAEAALQAAGFIVKVEHPQGISPLNIVYSQKPEGGEGKTARKGSTIVINVF